MLFRSQPSGFVSNKANGNFTRKRVELGVCSGDLVEVTQGLDDNDEMVTVGAQQLAAEETKANLAVEDND